MVIVSQIGLFFPGRGSWDDVVVGRGAAACDTMEVMDLCEHQGKRRVAEVVRRFAAAREDG